MDSWHNTREQDRLGIAIYNYSEEKPYALQLTIGDAVHLLKECKDWYYGCLVRKKGKKGAFPKSYIETKQSCLEKVGFEEIVMVKEPPVAQEITSVLREWVVLWQGLYTTSLMRDRSKFIEIRRKMNALVDKRRQILSSKLPVDELKVLHQQVTNIIDTGNAILGLDVVVRDDDGFILDPLKTSTIELYRRHHAACQNVLDAEPQGNQSSTTSSFTVMVNVKTFVCHVGEPSEVLMTLYDVTEGKPVSENYVMKWTEHGMPKNINLLNKLSVLFTDLGGKDAIRDRVYLVCQVIRTGGMEVIKEKDNKKATRDVRRLFGIAGHDVTDIIRGTGDSGTEKPIFIPFLHCGEKDNFDGLLKKVFNNKEINHKGQGIHATITKLSGDSREVHKRYAHLVHSTASVSRKMGFPDVIMPNDVRNDVYVTICQAEFRRNNLPHKTSEKNVELTVTVCGAKGEIIPGVISEGAGGELVDSFRSVVYYHEDKPRWDETFKISLAVEDTYGAHLRFSFKHRSSFENKDKNERHFAVSFIKLMQENGTTLGDKDHDLLVYKVDSKTRQLDASVYLRLPSSHADLQAQNMTNPVPQKYQFQAGPLTLNMNDGFLISTTVCSTKLTQNVDLMGLLKWRENPSGLKYFLSRLMTVDGSEVVKFLHDTLDALFQILMAAADAESYNKSVFDALIFIIGLTFDRRFHQFRPVLDVYIKENFSATLAYSTLLVVLKDTIFEARNPSRYDTLHKALNCIEYLFKFIIRSRVLFAALKENKLKQQFEVSVRQLLEALNELMTSPGDSYLTVKEAALKNLPSAVEQIMTVFCPVDLSNLLSEMAMNIPKDQLVIEKLCFFKTIVHTDLFKLPECRSVLLPYMLRLIKTRLENESELDEALQLLCDVMNRLYRNDMGSTSKDISTIAFSVLRTVTQTVVRLEKASPYMGSSVSVMTSLLRQMTETHYADYIAAMPTVMDLTDFFLEILEVFRQHVTRRAFPSDWSDMIMIQNSVYLKAMRYFSFTIKHKFTTPFNYKVWSSFFYCAIAFVTHHSLQLENFSSTKRNKVISKYKDMRMEIALEIRSMWFNLESHKHHFIPSLVGPILEMTLIPEQELRRATIPIFYDMMQCEFLSLHFPAKRGSFARLEAELVTKLDTYFEQGLGDAVYIQLFYTILTEKCKTHQQLREPGCVFVQTVRELLQHLLEYREIARSENSHNRMSCTVNLLNFYHDTARTEMYVRYIHKLRDLHLDQDNFTEAAHTLLLYCGLLEWSDKQLSPILRSRSYPSATTHRELKEKITYDVIKYFGEGKMWERGIEYCKVLIHQYETETLDYSQISPLLTKQAVFYSNILDHHQIRPQPEYFRVSYYGMGFPTFLQNKTFVYRGEEYERLTDFMARLQNEYPNAQLLKSLDHPGEEIKCSTNLYLQINSVTPVMEEDHKFYKKDVNLQILKYYKVNEVQKFSYTRRIKNSKSADDDVTNMWLERSYLRTTHSLPGILRWFPVTSWDMVDVSPVENARETLDQTNEKIRRLLAEHRVDPTMRIDGLSMVLNGVVDAAVQGGITNYKKFYLDEFLPSYAQDRERSHVAELKSSTVTQMKLLHEALSLHGRMAPETLKPFHAFIVQRFNQMKELVENDYKLKLPEGLSLEALGADRSFSSPRQTEGPTTPTESKSLRRLHARSALVPLDLSVTLAARDRASKNSPSTVRAQSAFIHRLTTVGSGALAVSPSRESPPTTYVRVSSHASRSSLSTHGSIDALNASPTSSPTPRSKSISKSPRITESKVIELNETLTPLRPRRPEAKSRSSSRPGSRSNSRPNSGSFHLSSPPDQNELEDVLNAVSKSEEPPPLPRKGSAHGELRTQSSIAGGRSPSRQFSTQSQAAIQFSMSVDEVDVEAPNIPPKKPSRIGGKSFDSSA